MKIVFATNNQHKLQEIRDILGSEFEVVSLKEIGCDVNIPETGNTLEENALQKAQYVYDHYHLSCFADDTYRKRIDHITSSDIPRVSLRLWLCG